MKLYSVCNTTVISAELEFWLGESNVVFDPSLVTHKLKSIKMLVRVIPLLLFRHPHVYDDMVSS